MIKNITIVSLSIAVIILGILLTQKPKVIEAEKACPLGEQTEEVKDIKEPPKLFRRI